MKFDINAQSSKPSVLLTFRNPNFDNAYQFFAIVVHFKLSKCTFPSGVECRWRLGTKAKQDKEEWKGGLFDLSYFDNRKVAKFNNQKVSFTKKNQ